MLIAKTIFMDSTYLSIVKNDYSNGRTEFACFLDRLLFCAGVYLGAYLLFFSRIRNEIVCIILSASLSIILFILLGMLRKCRIRKHEASMRTRVREELMQYKLLTFEINVLHSEISKVCPDAALILSNDELTINDVAEAVRNARVNGCQSVSIFSIKKPSLEAETFIEAISPYFPVKHGFFSSNRIIADLVNVSEDEISNEIVRRGKTKRRRLISFSLSDAVEQNRLIKYFALGGATYFLSFVVKYGLYMRIFSLILLALAGICATVKKIASKK